MGALVFIPSYFRWHYSQALDDLLNISKNSFSFVLNVFSVKELTLNLFSPFERITVDYSREWSFEGTVGAWIVNGLMRLVGAVIRLIIILLGLISLAFALILSIIAFFIWLLWPFLIVVSFLLGLKIFFI